MKRKSLLFSRLQMTSVNAHTIRLPRPKKEEFPVITNNNNNTGSITLPKRSLLKFLKRESLDSSHIYWQTGFV